MSALDRFYSNKFTIVLILSISCFWTLTMSQLDGCSEGEAICNTCHDNQYGAHCLSCDCDHFGSLGSCDPVSGACYCRKGVESRRCNTCGRQGWIGPSITSSQEACLKCFCNGYSNNCTPADEWYKASVSDYFSVTDEITDWRDAKGGNVTFEEEGFLRVVGVAGGVELLFPAKYLGDKRTMFGQQLLLTLRQSSQRHNFTMVTVRISTIVSSPYDDGLQLKIPPVAIGNNWQTIQVTMQLMVRGNAPATEEQLRRVLTNISSIALATMEEEEEAILDVLTVHMDYAKPKVLTNGDATSVDYVEECHCPLGREGRFCDKCSPGYARDPPYGGPFAACVKCYCSNKAVSCDPETGVCQNCTNNTAGDHCEHCHDGYYRNLISGMCLPCQCPGTPDQSNHFASSCDVTADNNVTCSCISGYVGDMCSVCDEGYYGNPLLPSGNCTPCNCHGNADTTLPMCNTTTGMCNCIHPYVGSECELCADDYYGNAEQQNCNGCDCGTEGTVPGTVCNQTSGQCVCKDHVTGRRCDQCESGYWNLTSNGCISCNCYSIGSIELSCDQLSGKCSCRHSYTGVTCDVCSDGYYRHSNGSCVVCECEGEASLGCDRLTGQCICREGVTGRSCDACEEGTDNLWPDCLTCVDECYALWNDSVFQLTEVVNANISKAFTSNVSSVNVSMEEFDQLYDIVNDIFGIVNSSNLSVTELNRVDELVVMLMQQIITQLQAANAVNVSAVNITVSEVMLLEQLEIIKRTLAIALNDLNGLQLELPINDGTNLSSQVQRALNRSLQAYEVVSDDVQITIDLITNSSEFYDEKLKTFLSIENQIHELLSLVNNATEFAGEKNSFLCGNNASLTDSECAGIFEISLITASQIVTSIREVNGYLRMVAIVESQLMELSDTLELSLQNLSEISDYRLPDEVMMLRDDMLNLNEKLSDKLNSSILLLMESLANQLLQLSLNSTPVEVMSVVNMINGTISEFPSDSDIREVISRINTTLHLSISSQQRSAEVASDSSTAAMNLEQLEEKHNSTVDNKDRINNTLGSFIGMINSAKDSLDEGEMKLQQLNSNQSLLNSTIIDVTLHVNDNSQFANLLNNTSNKIYNSSVNSTQEWSKANDQVNELLSNSSTKASTSYQLRNRSEQLLSKIKNLLNATEEHQNTLNRLQEQYRNQAIRYQMIEDDVRSVRITLEALIRDISKIATANSDCINPLSGG